MRRTPTLQNVRSALHALEAFLEWTAPDKFGAFKESLERGDRWAIPARHGLYESIRSLEHAINPDHYALDDPRRRTLAVAGWPNLRTFVAEWETMKVTVRKILKQWELDHVAEGKAPEI